jgi:hypothetical protein
MFAAAQLMLLNKVDLLPYLQFDVEKAIAAARRVNPMVTGVVRANGTAARNALARHRMPGRSQNAAARTKMVGVTDIVTVTVQGMAIVAVMAAMAGPAAGMTAMGKVAMLAIVDAGDTPDMAAMPAVTARAFPPIAAGAGPMVAMPRRSLSPPSPIAAGPITIPLQRRLSSLHPIAAGQLDPPIP